MFSVSFGGGYGGYGYGGCHNSFGHYGNSHAWGGGYGGHHHHHNSYGGYGGGGYYGGYGGYGGYRRRSSGNFFSNLFGGYGCNRMYGRRRSSSDFGFGGCRWRSLEGAEGGADNGGGKTDIFSTYKGEVKPVQPYAFPNEYTGGKVKALFIGISYGGTPAELKGSCADVGVMLDTLKHIQFPLKEAAILVDDPKFAGANGLPTRENIIQHMLWLVKDAKAGDILFFHYSGHTSVIKAMAEGDAASNTLVPSDFQQNGMIADDDIFEILVRSLAEGVRMTIVMDCSEGSGVVDLPFAYIPPPTAAQQQQQQQQSPIPQPKYGPKMMAEKTYLRQQSKGEVIMLCGVGGTNDGSGACTNALSIVLRETAGLDYIGLTAAMKAQLDQRNIQQIPRLSASKPMQLTTAFSLFGITHADTHFYDVGSLENCVAWSGPIPYSKKNDTNNANANAYTPSSPNSNGGNSSPMMNNNHYAGPTVAPPASGFVAFGGNATDSNVVVNNAYQY